MGALETNTTLIYGIHIRESANDGSDFSNGATDYRVLFLGEDGYLHVKDSAGSVTNPYNVTGGAVTGASDINIYTGGDITLNNTTLTAVTGPTDLVVAAASGDCLMVGMSARPVTTTAQSIAFDFATIVSAAPVNYVFAGSGTPINIPVAWYIGPSEVSSVNGGFPYIVQAGDISGGNVTLRLYFRSSGSRVIEADAAAPLVTWVHNLKQ